MTPPLSYNYWKLGVPRPHLNIQSTIGTYNQVSAQLFVLRVSQYGRKDQSLHLFHWDFKASSSFIGEIILWIFSVTEIYKVCEVLWRDIWTESALLQRCWRWQRRNHRRSNTTTLTTTSHMNSAELHQTPDTCQINSPGLNEALEVTWWPFILCFPKQFSKPRSFVHPFTTLMLELWVSGLKNVNAVCFKELKTN